MDDPAQTTATPTQLPESNSNPQPTTAAASVSQPPEVPPAPQPTPTAPAPATPETPPSQGVMGPAEEPAAETVTVKIPDEPPVKKKGISKKLILIILLILIPFILLGAGIYTVYAVAYEKTNINNQAVSYTVTKFVQGLSFTPKTAKFLMTSAYLAHKDLKSNGFDVSLAVSSKLFTQTFGKENVDLSLKGAGDYSVLEKPKFWLTGKMGKDLDFEIRLKEQSVYLKINKVPKEVLTYLYGFSDEKFFGPVFANWAKFETDSLNTEARQTLEENKAKEAFIFNPFDETTIGAMKVSDEKVDEFPSFKLHLVADKKILDNWERKMLVASGAPLDQGAKLGQQHLSDFAKDMTVDLWIDKKDYYLRKGTVSFKLIPPETSNPATKVLGLSTLTASTNTDTSVTIVAVVKMSNFGQMVTIKEPDKFVKGETYLATLFSMMPSQMEKQALAADERRRLDMAEIFASLQDCKDKSGGRYVVKLDDLVTCKTIESVPTDPVKHSAYDYRANTLRSGFVLRAYLSDGKPLVYTEKTSGIKF